MSKNSNNLIIYIIIIIMFLFGLVFGVLFSSQIIKYASGQVDMIYNCHNYFNKAMYDCPTNLQYINKTGMYCDKVLLCENQWRAK